MNKHDLDEIYRKIDQHLDSGKSLQSLIDDFLTGSSNIKEAVPGLNACRCGCRGDYTEHSMRAGESGRYSSEIVR